MAKCSIISFMVPDDCRLGAGGCHTEFRCETHGFGPQMVATSAGQDGPMCPIGMIEEATEKALAKIAAARI